jgi:hypothetical protein
MASLMVSLAKLMYRLAIAWFRIMGYLVTFLLQLTLYWRLGGLKYRYKLGDAFGQLGKGIIDALADAFRW